MTAALIILASLIVVGTILRLTHRPDSSDEKAPVATETPTHNDSECCGLHAICEREFAAIDDNIIYYDDEELDQYADRQADSYSNDEIEQFRDILLTLLPHDISGWARSLKKRNIQLPPDVRDEMIMLLDEARTQQNQPTQA